MLQFCCSERTLEGPSGITLDVEYFANATASDTDPCHASVSKFGSFGSYELFENDQLINSLYSDKGNFVCVHVSDKKFE